MSTNSCAQQLESNNQSQEEKQSDGNVKPKNVDTKIRKTEPRPLEKSTQIQQMSSSPVTIFASQPQQASIYTSAQPFVRNNQQSRLRHSKPSNKDQNNQHYWWIAPRQSSIPTSTQSSELVMKTAIEGTMSQLPTYQVSRLNTNSSVHNKKQSSKADFRVKRRSTTTTTKSVSSQMTSSTPSTLTESQYIQDDNQNQQYQSSMTNKLQHNSPISDVAETENEDSDEEEED